MATGRALARKGSDTAAPTAGCGGSGGRVSLFPCVCVSVSCLGVLHLSLTLTFPSLAPGSGPFFPVPNTPRGSLRKALAWIRAFPSGPQYTPRYAPVSHRRPTAPYPCRSQCHPRRQTADVANPPGAPGRFLTVDPFVPPSLTVTPPLRFPFRVRPSGAARHRRGRPA